MSEMLVDYVDTQDNVVGSGSLATVQSTFQPHRWFFIFIYNDAGEILMLHRSEVHETSPNCWDVSCEGPVASGEDYHTAARRTLQGQLGIPWETAPLRPFTRLPAALQNSMRFIQLYTCGPLNGPFEPASAEFAELAFARPEDVDALVESSPGEIAESLQIAWAAREELAAQLANPSAIVSPPMVQVPETVPVPIASIPALPSSLASELAHLKPGAPGAGPGTGMAYGTNSASTEASRESGSGVQVSAGMIGGAAILLFKFGAFFLKFAKVWLSMLLSIWAYSTVYGWPFATGFILLIFVHEMGHVFAARWVGMPVSAPMFIPFFGAFISLNENPRDAWSEAIMAYGGPLAGAIGATLCALAGLAFNSPLLMALGLVTFVMNLFNMAPVPPLDGGRICAAVSTWFWFVGILILGLGLFYFKGVGSIVLIILILYYGFRRMSDIFSPTEQQQSVYYNIPLASRFLMGFLYFGLIAYMFAGDVTAGVLLHRIDPQLHQLDHIGTQSEETSEGSTTTP